LSIIEEDIEGAFPAFERHLEQVRWQSNGIRDTLREDVEAIAIWIACMEHLGKLPRRDKEGVEWFKIRLREHVRIAARALRLAEQSDTLVLSYGELVEDMARWLERSKKQKAVNGS
jgi:hypothetical protein